MRSNLENENIYTYRNAKPNKGLFLSKKLFSGCGIGAFTSLAVINPSIILVSLLAVVLYLDSHLKRMWGCVLFLAMIIAVWIFLKWWLINGVGKHVVQDVYLIIILGLFSIFSLRDNVLKGFIVIFSPLVLLDFISNVMQAAIGFDLFGNIPDLERSDGIRLVGIFGHSFKSLALYFSLFLLLSAAGFKRTIAYMPLFMMLIVGSMRAYIFIPLLIFCNVIFELRWRSTFFIAILISIAIAAATVLSISEELISGQSGNAFRIFAWQNAIDVITKNPFAGTSVAPTPLPSDFVVTEQNLIDYEIYESAFLQDAARYGLPFVLLKLIFLYLVGMLSYQKGKEARSQLAKTKNFIMMFLVIDYFVFSYFSMPAAAMVAALVLGTRDQNLHNDCAWVIRR